MSPFSLLSSPIFSGPPELFFSGSVYIVFYTTLYGFYKFLYGYIWFLLDIAFPAIDICSRHFQKMTFSDFSCRYLLATFSKIDFFGF